MVTRERKQAILDRVRGIAITDTLAMELIAMSDGECEMRAPRETRFDGVFDSLHGGILMTIADSVACFALFTLTGPDEIVTTTDMNIRFLAPCLSDVTARARVIKLGRTLCPIEVNLYDADGRHVAVAQVTYMRLANATERSK